MKFSVINYNTFVVHNSLKTRNYVMHSMQTGCVARLKKTQRRETDSGTDTIQSLIGQVVQ